MLFVHGAYLVLRSNVVLTVLDLDEVNVSLENAKILGLVLSGEGGFANGWRLSCSWFSSVAPCNS